MTSLDLSPTWEAYVISLGFGFHQWDINDGNLLQKLGLAKDQLDYVIISYVMIYVTNDKVLDMLKDLLLKDGVRAIIMSERSEATAACGLMEKRGIHCSRLMSQTLGRDERQCVFVSDSSKLKSASEGDVLINPTFKNVPFCEHKKERQEKGKKLNWRPFHEEK